MITWYCHEAMVKWNAGEFKVQLLSPRQSKPIGYCDGTEEDEEELRSRAEEEGLDDLPIAKKFLWTGREIWTVGPTSDPDATWEEP